MSLDDIGRAGWDSALRDAITAALAKHAGNLSAAARELGTTQRTLRRAAQRLGLRARGIRA